MTQETPDARLAALRAVPLDGDWFKSSYSASNGGGCFEFMKIKGGVALRDSKDPNGPVLRFTHGEIAALLEGANAGEFDELRGDA